MQCPECGEPCGLDETDTGHWVCWVCWECGWREPDRPQGAQLTPPTAPLCPPATESPGEAGEAKRYIYILTARYRDPFTETEIREITTTGFTTRELAEARVEKFAQAIRNRWKAPSLDPGVQAKAIEIVE